MNPNEGRPPYTSQAPTSNTSQTPYVNGPSAPVYAPPAPQYPALRYYPQESGKKPKAGRTVVALIACLLIVAVCFSAGWILKGDGNEKTYAPSNGAGNIEGAAAQPGPGVGLPPATASRNADGSYPNGIYEIGVDIPEGEYTFFSADKKVGRFMVFSALHGASEHLVDEGFYEIGYLTVKSGNFLFVEGADVFLPEPDAPAYTPGTGGYGNGQYKVGKDIPAGTYTFRGNGANGGSVDLNKTSGHRLNDYSDIVRTKWLDSGEEVTMPLVEGQYLTLYYIDVISAS